MIQDIDPSIVGFEFPTLDFIICVPCAQTCPQTLKEAVEEATGMSYPETFLQVAQEQFAIRDSDPVVDLLNCHLIECQKPLIHPSKGTPDLHGNQNI